jgi:hypothetical protein
MGKTSRTKSLPDPDPRDIRIASLETALSELRKQIEDRIGDLGDAKRENGRLNELAQQWKKAAEDRGATVSSLRDQCADMERRLAELTGYTVATIETLERMEGVTIPPETPPQPIRRRVPSVDRRDTLAFAPTVTGSKPWWRA